MEIDVTFANQVKLTVVKRKRRIDEKLCMYTGCDIKDAVVLARHKDGCLVKKSL